MNKEVNVVDSVASSILVENNDNVVIVGTRVVDFAIATNDGLKYCYARIYHPYLADVLKVPLKDVNTETIHHLCNHWHKPPFLSFQNVFATLPVSKTQRQCLEPLLTALEKLRALEERHALTATA